MTKRLIAWPMAALCLVLFAVPVFAADATTANLTWGEVTTYNTGELIPTGVDVGYICKWGTQPGNYTELHDAGWDQLNYTMTNLVPGTTYYISARAYTSLNEVSNDSPDYVYLHVGASRVPVYRFMNLQYGFHLYTISESEKNKVISTLSATWQYEGIKFYAGATQTQ